MYRGSELMDAVPKEEYDQWMQEIAALTPKQQRKWKAIGTSQLGVQNRIRYRNGELESYSARVHTWVPCTCLNDMLEDKNWQPMSEVGLAGVRVQDVHVRVARTMLVNAVQQLPGQTSVSGLVHGVVCAGHVHGAGVGPV